MGPYDTEIVRLHGQTNEETQRILPEEYPRRRNYASQFPLAAVCRNPPSLERRWTNGGAPQPGVLFKPADGNFRDRCNHPPSPRTIAECGFSMTVCLVMSDEQPANS